MESPNERLRRARIEAGYKTAADAARALGISGATYNQHENDTRGLGGIPRKAAERYAEKFKVSLDWLLTGRGGEAAFHEPSEDELAEMLKSALDVGVTMETRLADLPRIVAPVLREQLRRYRADRAAADSVGEQNARGRSARSRAPTRSGGPAE